MLLLSISLSIKMNVLLFFPAVLLLLFEVAPPFPSHLVRRCYARHSASAALCHRPDRCGCSLHRYQSHGILLSCFRIRGSASAFSAVESHVYLQVDCKLQISTLRGATRKKNNDGFRFSCRPNLARFCFFSSFLSFSALSSSDGRSR